MPCIRDPMTTGVKIVAQQIKVTQYIKSQSSLTSIRRFSTSMSTLLYIVSSLFKKDTNTGDNRIFTVTTNPSLFLLFSLLPRLEPG